MIPTIQHSDHFFQLLTTWRNSSNLAGGRVKNSMPVISRNKSTSHQKEKKKKELVKKKKSTDLSPKHFYLKNFSGKRNSYLW